jgi:hypothetical protein
MILIQSHKTDQNEIQICSCRCIRESVFKQNVDFQNLLLACIFENLVIFIIGFIFIVIVNLQYCCLLLQYCEFGNPQMMVCTFRGINMYVHRSDMYVHVYTIIYKF